MRSRKLLVNKQYHVVLVFADGKLTPYFDGWRASRLCRRFVRLADSAVAAAPQAWRKRHSTSSLTARISTTARSSPNTFGACLLLFVALWALLLLTRRLSRSIRAFEVLKQSGNATVLGGTLGELTMWSRALVSADILTLFRGLSSGVRFATFAGATLLEVGLVARDRDSARSLTSCARTQMRIIQRNPTEVRLVFCNSIRSFCVLTSSSLGAGFVSAKLAAHDLAAV